MPIYTYLCNNCGEKFDLLVGITAEKTELKCNKCDSKNIKKVFGTFSMGESSCSTGTCPTCY